MPRQRWQLQRRFSYDLTGLPMPLLLLRSRRMRQRVSSALLIGNVIALCAWLIVSRVLSLRRRTKQVRTLDFSKFGIDTLRSRGCYMTPSITLKSPTSCGSKEAGNPGQLAGQDKKEE